MTTEPQKGHDPRVDFQLPDPSQISNRGLSLCFMISLCVGLMEKFPSAVEVQMRPSSVSSIQLLGIPKIPRKSFFV